MKPLQPLSIAGISLAFGHALGIARIDQKYLKATCFKDLVSSRRSSIASRPSLINEDETKSVAASFGIKGRGPLFEHFNILL